MIFPLTKAEEILVVGIRGFMNLEIAYFQDLLGCISSKTIVPFQPKCFLKTIL